VEFYSQIVGVVCATTTEKAKAAAKKVKLQLLELPVINTIDDAVAAGSLITNEGEKLPLPEEFQTGDIEKGFAEAEQVIEDEWILSGAEHYYLEPHCHLVVPGERNHLTIYSTTQGPAAIGAGVAVALGVLISNISVVCKRLGGGFGGKGNGSFDVAAALCAVKTGRPVKFQVDRDLDLLTTGKRACYKAKYRCGFRNDGTLTAMDFHVWHNAGFENGFSKFLCKETIESLDNCYRCPNWRIKGTTVKTNRVSSVAYRGAGTPQALAVIETAMDNIAVQLKISPKLVRERNFLKIGDTTPFHQVIKPAHYELDKLWGQLVETSKYDEKEKAVKEFNAKNQFKKRGVSIVPTRYNMVPPLVTLFLKATVTLSMHRDGSALLCHGGIEMGQGVNTKLIQICSQTLGIPFEAIFTPASSTVTSPNAPSTGGSMTVDYFGPAIIDACNQILKRIEPFKKEGDSVTQRIMVAAASGAVLNVMGQFEFKNWGFPHPLSHDFLYYTWNGVVCEAEIDLLTGESKLLSADIVQDMGRSLNPAIDIGQVEGGFIQGYSWLTTEDVESCYAPNGKFNLNPESLEIACFKNVPEIMNVSLYKGMNAANPDAPYGSKGTGEPPQSMGIAGALAIRAAVTAARESNGLPAWQSHINYPLTNARVYQATGRK